MPLRTAALPVAAFLLAFIGTLLAIQVWSGFPEVLLAVGALGFVAGALAGSRAGLVAFWAGLVCTYPAALALGLILYLAEAWQVALVLSASGGALGYVLGVAARRVVRRQPD